jgi:hypothetical protein
VPTAGSYASTLDHFERVTGELPGKKSHVRCLLVFQDPRGGEENFTACDPLLDPKFLGRDKMRYFCMNSLAWRVLGLDKATRSENPCWPTDATAHHYLRRYLQSRGVWSYEGIIAYFLHLFRPGTAYITNLAKCHFGENQNGKVFRTCKLAHFRDECRAFSPNLVLSFTRKMKNLGGLPMRPDTAFLSLLHPARNSMTRKRRRFEDATEGAAIALGTLGYEPDYIRGQWNHDCDRVARS